MDFFWCLYDYFKNTVVLMYQHLTNIKRVNDICWRIHEDEAEETENEEWPKRGLRMTAVFSLPKTSKPSRNNLMRQKVTGTKITHDDVEKS